MPIFVLSDPHLSFSTPHKSMEAFGPMWTNYEENIQRNWCKLITEKDLVFIPGDISWATHLEDALVDLKWIAELPGTKLLLKGNHDFWWESASKMAKVMPSSMYFLHNNTFDWEDITIGGARLWDSDEYNFQEYIHFQDNPKSPPKTYEELENQKQHDRKIFERELERLKMSLSKLNPQAKTRIALTHYPPIGADLFFSRASQILEHFQIQICVFGHLHSVKKNRPLFGEIRGVRYILASCDYLDFTPLRIL
jgi:uncharacterized protein